MSEARIETDRPSRYLVQLCRHFGNKGRHLRGRTRRHQAGHASAEIEPSRMRVEWSETHEMVDFGWGSCTMRAAPGELMLLAKADDETSLRQVQDLVATHLSRFGRRDGLEVHWERTSARGTSGPKPGSETEDSTRHELERRESAGFRPDGREPAWSGSVPRERGLRVAVHHASHGHRSGRLRAYGSAVIPLAVVVLVAGHLGLGGALVAGTQWVSSAAGLILVIVLVKVIVLGGLVIIRRGRASKVR